MKKSHLLILTLAFIFLTGCSVYLDKYSQSTSLIDFSNYFNKGVYMSTGDFHATYAPTGIIEATCYDGYKLKDGVKKAPPSNTQNQRDELYDTSISSDKMKDYDFKKCSINDLLDSMFLIAKENGANGIINIEIQPIRSTNQSGIRIVGMGIKY